MPLKFSFVPNGECIPNTKHKGQVFFRTAHDTKKERLLVMEVSLFYGLC